MKFRKLFNQLVAGKQLNLIQQFSLSCSSERSPQSKDYFWEACIRTPEGFIYGHSHDPKEAIELALRDFNRRHPE